MSYFLLEKKIEKNNNNNNNKEIKDLANQMLKTNRTLIYETHCTGTIFSDKKVLVGKPPNCDELILG